MQHVSFFLLALGKALADMRPPTSYSPVNRSLLIISKNKNPPWNQPGAQKTCLSSRDFTAAHPNPQPDLECQVSFLSRSLYFIPSEDLDVVKGGNFRQTQFLFLWFLPQVGIHSMETTELFKVRWPPPPPVSNCHLLQRSRQATSLYTSLSCFDFYPWRDRVYFSFRGASTPGKSAWKSTGRCRRTFLPGITSPSRIK